MHHATDLPALRDRPGERPWRRAFVLGLAVLALVAAGCGNGDSDDAASTSGPDGALVLGTLEKPATLPTFDNIKPIPSSTKPEKGTLTIYSYNDYVNPDVVKAFEKKYGVKVQFTTYDTEDEVTQKLRSGAVKVDAIMGITDFTLPRLAAGRLLRPLTPELLPHSSNVAQSLQSPFYDVGGVYSRPYTFYKVGIGYRSDLIDQKVVEAKGWDVLWDKDYDGYVGMLDDSRDGLSLALLHLGETDLNTGDEAKLDAAVDDLKKMVDATSARVDTGVYQKVPEGQFHVSQAWSGDMLLGKQYLPEGIDETNLGFWNPPVPQVGNDLITVTANSKHPALAHAFIDFLMTPENAQKNFEFTGYQPALIHPSPEELVGAGLVPENLRSSLVTPEELAKGLREDALDTPTQTKWENAWSKFKAG